MLLRFAITRSCSLHRGLRGLEDRLHRDDLAERRVVRAGKTAQRIERPGVDLAGLQQSVAIGAASTRGGFTSRLGTVARPSVSISLTSGGYSTALACTASINGRSAMCTTYSSVARMLRAVSL